MVRDAGHEVILIHISYLEFLFTIIILGTYVQT